MTPAPEFDPPRLTPRWKAGLLALTVSAVLAVAGTFQMFFTYADPGLGSDNAPESFRVTSTMWNNSTGVFAVVPKFGIPVVTGSGLLLVAVAVLLIAARRGAVRGQALGRALSFASAFLIGGALWATWLYVSAIEAGWRVSVPGLLFDRGPALALIAVACGLALAGSALVLGRALGDPRPVPAVVVYRLPDDVPS
jgi:hypothetical protein